MKLTITKKEGLGCKLESYRSNVFVSKEEELELWSRPKGICWLCFSRTTEAMVDDSFFLNFSVIFKICTRFTF